MAPVTNNWAVFLIRSVFRAAKGSGVNDTKSAVYISNGTVPAGALVGKFLWDKRSR